MKVKLAVIVDQLTSALDQSKTVPVVTKMMLRTALGMFNGKMNDVPEETIGLIMRYVAIVFSAMNNPLVTEQQMNDLITNCLDELQEKAEGTRANVNRLGATS